MLLNIGSSLDSTFRSFIRSRALAGVPGVQNLYDKEKLDILDYRKAYAPAYPLAAKAVYLLLDHSAIWPWEAWGAAGREDPPPWWTAHNRVKHDRFANAQQATLGTVIEALAGFFSVCNYLIETRRHLVTRQVIMYPGNLPPQGFSWQIEQHNDPSDVFFAPIFGRTRLYALFLSSDKNEEGQKQILDLLAPL